MAQPESKSSFSAVFGLLVVTAVWGLSFTLFRAMGLMAQTNLSASAEVMELFSTINVGFRFLVAGLFLSPILLYKKIVPNKNEILHGFVLAVFGGLGVYFQMHGLHSISASSSAFITQVYCVFIPWFAYFRNKTPINFRVVVSTALVLLALKFVTGFEWTQIHFKPGEWLTLLAAFLFTFQILSFDEKRFKGNRVLPLTFVMCIGSALCTFTLGFITSRSVDAELFRQVLSIQFDIRTLLITLILVLGPTLFSFLGMNYWQPKVNAVQAGLIYCTEPVWATLIAGSFPLFLSPFLGIDYAAETFHLDFFYGAILMTVAQIALFVRKPS